VTTAPEVSPTPVREALRRLEQKGLVERVFARKLWVVDHFAVAPGAVFTVRTKAISAAYGPALVFEFRRGDNFTYVPKYA
jgi:DNA-binding FadR family transcriptional regulator